MLAATPLIGQAKSRKRKTRQQRTHKKGGNAAKGPSVASVDAILAPLAEQMGHGTDHEGMSLGDLEWMIAQGQRVIALCGTQSQLGIRALGRAGVAARMVAPWTRGAWNGTTDSHTLLEARISGRWQVYDLTGNAQAVDARGRGVDVTTLCRDRPLRWRTFASDPIWTATSNAPADVNAWYEHVLQIPVIEHDGLWRFHDGENRARLESIHPSYRYADAGEWRKLTS